MQIESVIPLFALIIAVGGVVSAHFMGVKSAVSESKVYTDKRIDKLEPKIDLLIEQIKEIQIDLARGN